MWKMRKKGKGVGWGGWGVGWGQAKEPASQCERALSKLPCSNIPFSFSPKFSRNYSVVSSCQKVTGGKALSGPLSRNSQHYLSDTPIQRDTLQRAA